MIAVDATTHACLGLVGGEVWTRPGVVTEHHRDRRFEDRESHRWLAAAERAKEVLQPAAMITVVSDREGDIYPKWAALPQTGVHLLTRAMVDRRLVDGGTLFAAAAGFAVAGKRHIELPARQPDRAKRTAVVELRYGTVEICRPRDEQDRTLAKTVRLWLVDVREVDVHPAPGFQDIDRGESDNQCNGRQHLKIDDRFESNASDSSQIGHPRDSVNHRAKDDWRDQHADQLDEGVAEGPHPRREVRGSDAERDADPHRDQHPDPKLRPPGVAALHLR